MRVCAAFTYKVSACKGHIVLVNKYMLVLGVSALNPRTPTLIIYVCLL